MAFVRTLPLTLSVINYLPRVYALHLLGGNIGLPNPDTGVIILPQPIRLASETLERHGLYLGDDGTTLYLYLTRIAPGELVRDLFGVNSYDEVRYGKISLPVLENSFSQRVTSIVGKLRESRPGFLPLVLVKEVCCSFCLAHFIN